MRTSAVLLMALVVGASGCTGLLGGDQPQNDNTNTTDQNPGSQDDITRTQDYAGAGSNFTSASQKLDYTGNTEAAVKPEQPNKTSTFAGMARVTLNHGGDRFDDLRITAEFPGFANVRQGDVRTLALDRGVNNTVKSLGPEDYSFSTYQVTVEDGGKAVVVDPGRTPEYNMTADDRVLIEFTSFRNPSGAGDRTVEFEINSDETDTLYEPVRASLEIRE